MMEASTKEAYDGRLRLFFELGRDSYIAVNSNKCVLPRILT